MIYLYIAGTIFIWYVHFNLARLKARLKKNEDYYKRYLTAYNSARAGSHDSLDRAEDGETMASTNEYLYHFAKEGSSMFMRIAAVSKYLMLLFLYVDLGCRICGNGLFE